MNRRNNRLRRHGFENMSLLEFVLKAINRVRLLRRPVQCAAPRVLSNRKFAGYVRRRYLKTGFAEQSVIHALFAKIYRDVDYPPQLSEWNSSFDGKLLTVPLREQSLWLDWDIALSLNGHDVDVKQTYARMLRSDQKPAVFFDIGANYGTHTLIMLSQGVQTISFEPNPLCRAYIKELCAVNGYDAKIEALALGDAEGTVELAFPERDSWLGTIVESEKAELIANFELSTETVRLTTVDTFVRASGLRPDLIKIDTEGNETAVLRGSYETLRSTACTIIFESRRGKERAEIFDILDSLGYSIMIMPPAAKAIEPVSLGAFSECVRHNFAALPRPTRDI